MEDIVQGALAGIAIGGFVAVVIEANLIAVKALWRFNGMAAETAWVMSKALDRAQIIREQRRWQQLVETEDDEAEN